MDLHRLVLQELQWCGLVGAARSVDITCDDKFYLHLSNTIGISLMSIPLTGLDNYQLWIHF